MAAIGNQSKRSFVIFLLFLALFFPFNIRAQDNELCLSCHMGDDPDAPQIDPSEFNQSIHGKNVCPRPLDHELSVPHPLFFSQRSDALL